MSLWPLERHPAGLPAGTSMTDPAGGGACRFIPSYHKSSASGGLLTKMGRRRPPLARS